MSSIPSITEWIATALTTVAVRPDFRDSLHEELEQWLTAAVGVQVSGVSFFFLANGVPTKLLMQDTLRAVMRVELSINEDFAVPQAAKGLSDEVKGVRAWLEGSALFGDPQILTEEVAPATVQPELDVVLDGGPGGGDREVSATMGESGGVVEPLVSALVSQRSLGSADSCAAWGECAECPSEAFGTTESFAEAASPLGRCKTAASPVLRGGGRHPSTGKKGKARKGCHTSFGRGTKPFPGHRREEPFARGSGGRDVCDEAAKR
jgi:hypothetical protein